MGKAGTFPAGRYPAGLGDPVVLGGPTSPAPSPASLRVGPQRGSPEYDLGTRQIIQNGNGTFRSIHWVDLQVRLALGIRLGSIPSSPTTGSAALPPRQTANAPAQGVADMKAATRKLVVAGHIRILSVSVDNSTPGRTLRYFDYLNLRLPKASPTQLTGF